MSDLRHALIDTACAMQPAGLNRGTAGNVSVRHGDGFYITPTGMPYAGLAPKEMLARLKLEKGDTVHITESPDGLVVTPYDPALEEQLRLGREFMREYRDTFHQLAK